MTSKNGAICPHCRKFHKIKKEIVYLSDMRFTLACEQCGKDFKVEVDMRFRSKRKEQK